jgi:DNA repair exonuclease SbcCD ATPase subunit
MLVEKAWKILNDLGSSEKYLENISEIQEKLSSIDQQKDDLNPDRIKSALKQIKNLETFKQANINEKAHVTSKILSYSEQLNFEQQKLDKLEEAYADYCKNKQAFDDKEEIQRSYRDCKTSLEACKKSIAIAEVELGDLYSSKGYHDNKLEYIIEEKEKLEQVREEYAAYDLYKKCMHPSGIPFEIIKRKLPEINEEVSKILSNVVNFEVFFEALDNKLEIYIKHPKHEPRPIETGSGAEKTLAATAIRLSLLAVSSLPKGDTFILDEPATELDEDTKEGFIRILDMIKIYFKNVILISHLDSLKDVVDMQITIEKKNGYAFVDVS